MTAEGGAGNNVISVVLACDRVEGRHRATRVKLGMMADKGDWVGIIGTKGQARWNKKVEEGTVTSFIPLRGMRGL